MATNVIFEAVSTLSLPVPNGTVSGQPLVLFSGKLPCLALTDEFEGGNADNYATVAVSGAVWVAEIPVHGEDAAGAAAISVGDLIAIDGDGEFNKDTTNGAEWGIALAAVASDATTTIRVLMLPPRHVAA